MNQVQLSQRIEEIIKNVNSEVQQGAKNGKPMEESVQIELAGLVSLLPDVDELADPHSVGVVEIAISALLKSEPDLPLALQIHCQILKRIRRSRNLLVVIFVTGTPAGRLVLGLISFLFIAIPLITAFILSLPTLSTIPDFNIPALLLVALSGASGSIVSIMTRIANFNYVTYYDSSAFFFTGFFKPFIGLFFALFVASVLKAEIIPMEFQRVNEIYFFIALSFVAGFSERFAQDLVSKVEGSNPSDSNSSK